MENEKNISHLEITEVVLVHCNIINSDYQQDSGVLHTFVPNKSFFSIRVYLFLINHLLSY